MESHTPNSSTSGDSQVGRKWTLKLFHRARFSSSHIILSDVVHFLTKPMSVALASSPLSLNSRVALALHAVQPVLELRLVQAAPDGACVFRLSALWHPCHATFSQPAQLVGPVLWQNRCLPPQAAAYSLVFESVRTI